MISQGLFQTPAGHFSASKSATNLFVTGSNLRFVPGPVVYLFFQIKRLRDLEKEKDALWCGLEIIEKARIWYLQQLRDNRAQQYRIETDRALGSCHNGAAEAWSCLLRSRIQRVNGSLGSVMSEPNVMSCSNPSLPETVTDCDLRWHNTLLTRELSGKNHQISKLELEKDALLEQLDEL
ncbi:Suppressor APC domain-containing protein 2 [Channa argus]|uniref:Suppressor APC domain-containing protein 2 n=1 Tax=Channa argus TaxID=215402 RepID=A0A6G1QQR1_CHAAH|nr:Suppressor APC domain-containing protein 2 [Channa argus]